MFALTILGNNSALPMHDRHPTSQLVTYDEHMFLLDCGEGTQIQMNRYKIRRSRVKYIFISHLHGDHYFGLAGLLNSYGLNGRTDDLWLFAPEALKEILDLQFKVSETRLPYQLHFHALNGEGLLVDEKKLTVSSFKVTHRIPCWGFIFKEKEKQKKLIPEKLSEYSIPTAFYHFLKEGEDYITKDGKIIRNEWVTLQASQPRSYAYCADTIYDENIISTIRGADLLYHEATYLDDLKERAASRFHSTSRQAATIALKAHAGKLLLGHFSSKYEKLDDFLLEASSIFPNVELATEGVTYRI